MRLLRVHTDVGLRDAVLAEDGRVVTLSGEAEAFDPIRWRERAAGANVETVAAFEDVRLAAPLGPGKIVCVGLNYADHAAEGGHEAPTEPILFLKAPDTVVGARDDIVIPRGSEKTDWEVELGVVIGRTAAYLERRGGCTGACRGLCLGRRRVGAAIPARARRSVGQGEELGDVLSARSVGATADEVPDPQAIKLGLEVNGDAVQDSSTAQMIFSVAHLVHYISQFMTLYPGDVISTGTPAGVGSGQQPPRFLRAGDVLRVWADGLGEQHSRLV